MNYDDVKSTIKIRLFNSFNAEKPSFKARKERPDDRSTKFVLSERKDTTGVKTDEFSIKNTLHQKRTFHGRRRTRTTTTSVRVYYSLLVALRLLSLLYTFIEAEQSFVALRYYEYDVVTVQTPHGFHRDESLRNDTTASGETAVEITNQNRRRPLDEDGTNRLRDRGEIGETPEMEEIRQKEEEV